MKQVEKLRADSLDPQMRAILDAVPPLGSLDIVEMRRHALASKKEWNKLAEVTVSVQQMGNGATLSVGGQVSTDRRLLHIHGGGWCIGSPETHLSLLAGLSEATDREVIAPRVRQAPEHPYPKPLEDVLQALTANGAEISVLSGDSAGANLALAAMLKARDAGDPLNIKGLVLFYGCFRPKFDTESHRKFGDGYGLTTQKMKTFWHLYAPEGGAYADLAGAAFKGLPPVQLHVAECDALADDTMWLDEQLRAAGVETELLIWPGMAHGFLHYPSALPAAQDAFANAARFVEAHA